MALACGVRAHRWSRFDDTEENRGKYLLAFGIVNILDHYTIRHKYYNSKAFTTRAKRAVIPPKCSNHLTECKKGTGRQHTTFTSRQNAAGSNFFLWWVYYILGATLWMSKCEFCRLFHTERSWHAYWFWSAYCFWSAWFVLWCKSTFFDLFWNVNLFLCG